MAILGGKGLKQWEIKFKPTLNLEITPFSHSEPTRPGKMVGGRGGRGRAHIPWEGVKGAGLLRSINDREVQMMLPGC